LTNPDPKPADWKPPDPSPVDPKPVDPKPTPPAAPDGNTPSLKDVVQAVFAHAADRMRHGGTPADIERDLVQNGLDPKVAAAVVQKLLAIRTEIMRRVTRRVMFMGIVLALGGLALFLGSWFSTQEAWQLALASTAMVLGVIQVLRALRFRSKHPAGLRS
jgi:hypothetical protein